MRPFFAYFATAPIIVLLSKRLKAFCGVRKA